VNQDTVRRQLEEVRESLRKNEQEREVLISLLKGYEGWLRLQGLNGLRATQITLDIDPQERGPKPKGKIGFRPGLLEVLKEARGEPLRRDEIWSRMQVIGVKSDAKDPETLIDLTARSMTPQVEKVASRTWRWAGE